jgi:aliphatic nitrilase
MATSPYRVAIVTEPPVYLDLQASVDKACALIAEAADNGSKLVVFGESWLPGYPFWVWLRSVPESLPLNARLIENSIELGSKEISQICRAARQRDVYVVMGVSERSGGTIYNSLLFINNKGTIDLVRRKIKPAGAERMIWGQGSGECLNVVPTSEFGVLGGHICWEHMMPGLDAAFCAQGEQVHIAAWPSFALDLSYSVSLEANKSLAQAYSLRTQSFVIIAAYAIGQDVVDRIAVTDRDRQIFHTGGGFAQVYAPDGSPMIEKPLESAGIAYAEIDLNRIVFAKMVCDSAGHAARPDLLQLTVNKGTSQTVSFVGREEAKANEEDEVTSK